MGGVCKGSGERGREIWMAEVSIWSEDFDRLDYNNSVRAAILDEKQYDFCE